MPKAQMTVLLTPQEINFIERCMSVADGEGAVSVRERRTMLGLREKLALDTSPSVVKDCEACGGCGHIYYDTCGTCDGSGKVTVPG